jgi:hypothetical protein
MVKSGKKSWWRVGQGLIWGLLLWGGMAATGWADVVRLKDGTVLRGKVLSFQQRRFTIAVTYGGSTSQFVIAADEIESIEFEASEGGAPPIARSAPPPVGGGPAPGVGAGGGGSVGATAPPRVGKSGVERPAEPRPAAAGGTSSPTSRVLVEKTVTVPAAADWTSTEIRVQKGQLIVLNASGEVDLGNGRRSGPAGIEDLPDNAKYLAGRATGGLVAVVGDDNDQFQFVGRSSEFVAEHNGILFLSVNEGTPRDNSGSFVVQVRVHSPR